MLSNIKLAVLLDNIAKWISIGYMGQFGSNSFSSHPNPTHHPFDRPDCVHGAIVELVIAFVPIERDT